MRKMMWMAGVLLVALALAAAWWYRAAPAAVEYRSAPITRGDLQAVVAATGAVNPVALVTVGTQVSGQIRDVLVDFNDEVQAGQLLAQLDPQTFDFRLRAAQADLDAAQAAVLTAQANALATQAQVARAQLDVREAQRNDARTQGLVEQKFVAQAEGERVRAVVLSTTEALKALQAQVGVAQAQVKQAQATAAQRQAALAQAGIDLGRTRITSPVAGIVIKRAIEPGQTVASSLQSPELFVIAKNLRDMQVEAAIDESDVGRLAVGQKATFTVDAFPGQTFKAEVRQVRKAALTVANVVTYVAVLSYANTDGRLLPGMTANVRVVTQERPGVLRVPNGALRLRIAGVEPPTKGPGLARLYALDPAGKPRAFAVRTGISDGSLTELVDDPQAPLGPDLAPGTEVLVALKTQPAAAPRPAGTRPGF